MIDFFAILFGLSVGSFLNVCIVRLPHAESIVLPSSHCRACDTEIRWYDNIPLLSYIALRGRCRSCRKEISARYPLVEALTALAALLLVRTGLPPLELVLYFLLAAALIVVTFIDIDYYIIPDKITLPSILIAPAMAYVVGHISVWQSLIGIAVGGGLLWAVAWAYQALRHHEGMGLGDVKLLAMIGGFQGWEAVLFTLMIGSLAGSVIGLAMVISKRQGFGMEIPFGPFLALGSFVYMLGGPALIALYLQLPPFSL